MITELYGNYGCYLGEVAVKLVVTHAYNITEGMLHDKVLSQYLYPEAYQETEGWVGSHGFDVDEEDEDTAEALHELVENACEYEVHPWDEDKWSGQFVGSVEGNTVHITIV